MKNYNLTEIKKAIDLIVGHEDIDINIIDRTLEIVKTEDRLEQMVDEVDEMIKECNKNIMSIKLTRQNLNLN